MLRVTRRLMQLARLSRASTAGVRVERTAEAVHLILRCDGTAAALDQTAGPSGAFGSVVELRQWLAPYDGSADLTGGQGVFEVRAHLATPPTTRSRRAQEAQPAEETTP